MEYLKFIKNPTIKRFFWKIKQIFSYQRSVEQIFHNGTEHPDQTFYVIRITWQVPAGLFAMLKSILSHIAYAIDKGMIPIIDMKHSVNGAALQDLSEDQEPWELLFEQPMAYTLTDVSRCKNVIVSNDKQAPRLNYEINVDITENRLQLAKYRAMFKKYIKPIAEAQLFLDAAYKQTINPSQRVLGILCRGTDYTLKKPKWHPIQPEPLEVIEKAKQVMTDMQCDAIYLATEDMGVYEMFQSHFGEQLLANNYKKYTEAEMQDVEYLSQITQNKREVQMGYLSSIYLLSKCCCFIGGRTSGTVGVYLMREGDFEYDYLWNLGYY